MSIKHLILETAARRGVFRPRDVPASSNPGHPIRRLVEEGILVRVGRGLYTLSKNEAGHHHGLALACAAIPGGVVCLLSALDYHGFTVQQPYHHWIAVDHTGPVGSSGIPVRIVRMTGQPFRVGVEKHLVDGNRIRVYGSAKTVADCFRYRNKIGIDVAVEALREGWRLRKFTMAELDQYARICRVANVMRPYKEMLIA